MTTVQNLTTCAHIASDTRFRVTSFAEGADPFVSLRIEGDFIAVALLAAHGTSEVLRNLAAAAIEAADALDAMATDEQEVTA
ncbi:hypothetical protein [Streptomyces sp. NPDC001537]